MGRIYKRKVCIDYEQAADFYQRVRNGESQEKLANSIGSCFKTFNYSLKYHGFILCANEDYFESIDSETKAYYLGFIFGDGCIQKGKGNRQYNLSFGLQVRDRLILDNFCDILTPYRKVEEFSWKDYNYPNTSTWQDQVRYKLSSTKLCEDLMRLGVYPAKSRDANMRIPTLREDLYRHFIRGFLDADGSVGNKCIFFGCSSKLFIEDIHNILLSNKAVERGSFFVMKKDDPTRRPLYTLEYYKYNYKSLYNYLYQDSTIFLARKKEKFNMTMPC